MEYQKSGSAMPQTAQSKEFLDKLGEKHEKFLDDFKRLTKPDDAAIFASSVGIQNEVRSLTLSLDTAVLSTQPYAISFPFRSLYVVDATDSNVEISLRIATIDSFQDAIPLRENTSYVLPFSTSKAFLHWSAQTSKTIKILFFVHGEFSTNTVQSIQSGSVTTSDGVTVTEVAKATVATTAGALFAADSTRTKMLISNFGAVDIFLGGTSAVTLDTGGFPGIKLSPGSSFAWETVAACYAISNGVSNTSIGLVKFTS